MSKSISLFSALLCTFIWGTTFIAQDTGMDNIGPFTFNAARFFVGFLAIIPLSSFFNSSSIFLNFSLLFFNSKSNVLIVFCREITKIYEEFIRKNVDELELFEKEPKGELTVVISEKKINKNLPEKLTESDINIIKKMINKLSTKEIAEILSQSTNVPKKEIYNYCLKLKNEK